MWKKVVVDVLGTVWLCGVCYLLGHLTVHLTWSWLSEYTTWWPTWLPWLVSTGTAGLLLFVITHMERGKLDPLGYPFMWLYLLVCLGFGLSTLHRSQYNVGTAAMELAFVYMLIWKISQKAWKERKVHRVRV